jgi:hypothetical protein
MDDLGAIGLGEEGIFERPSHFSSIDIESSSHLNIPGFVTSDIEVHQSQWFRFGVLLAGLSVEFNPLDKRTGAISNTYNGYSDRVLFHKS